MSSLDPVCLVTGAISGEYFRGCRRAKVSSAAATPENRALFWDLSTKAAHSTVAVDAVRDAS